MGEDTLEFKHGEGVVCKKNEDSQLVCLCERSYY